MHTTLLLSIVACALVGVNAAKLSSAYLPPTREPTHTTTVYATVTVPTFDTVTHTLNVATTRDVVVSQTFNTAQVFTVENTVHQPQAGRPNAQTSVVTLTVPSLSIETVRDSSNSVVSATVTSTVFRTSTRVETSTLRITHVDNVLEQTAVPVLTTVFVEEVETRTVTATLTEQVTSTITRPTLEPVVSDVTISVTNTDTVTTTRTLPTQPRTVTVTRTVRSTTSIRPDRTTYGYVPPTRGYLPPTPRNQ